MRFNDNRIDIMTSVKAIYPYQRLYSHLLCGEGGSVGKDNQFEYIRKTYGVDAYAGKEIRFGGSIGVIKGAHGNYLKILLDERPLEELLVHPTWEMEYLNDTIKSNQA